MQECVICKKDARENQLTIVENSADRTVFHITCNHCHHGMLAFLGNTQFGLGLVGLLTDLSSDDVLRLHGQEPMTGDELLHHYELLRDHSALFIHRLIDQRV